MVPMTFIWWIYHFWARFWPYFNFVDFRAFFGPFSLVNRNRQKMADLLRKMASNQKMQENKPTLRFNFTIEERWPVSKFSFWHSHWALLTVLLPQMHMLPIIQGEHWTKFNCVTCKPDQAQYLSFCCWLLSSMIIASVLSTLPDRRLPDHSLVNNPCWSVITVLTTS